MAQQKMEWRFNKERTIKFMGNLTMAISLIVTVLLIGGNDLVYAVMGKQRREFVVVQNGSKLLFPGNSVSLVLDLLYPPLPILVILMGLIFFFSELFYWMTYDPTNKFFKNLKWYSSIVPVALILFHLFGNFHYQFYCAVKVIPEENCFWMFDYRSLLTGPAGIIGCMPIFGVLYCFYKILSGKICFDRVPVTTPV